MAASTRGAPLPLGCTLGALMILAGGLLLLTWRLGAAAEREALAPTVIAEPVSTCALAPGSAYVVAANERQQPFYYLDQRSAEPIALSITHLFTQPSGSFWFSADTYYVYHTWDETSDGTRTLVTPHDGYLINVATRAITDVTTLPMPEQATILQRASERLRSIAYERVPPSGNSPLMVSPDGRYQFWDALAAAAEIVENSTAERPAVMNRVDAILGVELCLPGWRADSQGYYFIDRAEPWPNGGPLRLLLVDPPFPTWMWIWRGAGVVISLALLALAWQISRR